jgi:hypothetical protein
MVGTLDTTRILYPVPTACPAGIVALIVPALWDVSVPILTGVANEPEEFDNCAVKTFPGLKLPETVNGTFTGAPGQNSVGLMVPVVIALPEAMTKYPSEDPVLSELMMDVPLTVPCRVA